MSLLYALLPTAVFCGLFIWLFNQAGSRDVRWAFLRASILFQTYNVLSLEGLSLRNGITRLNLVIAWSLPLVALVIWIISRRISGHPIKFPGLVYPESWVEWILAFIVTLTVVITTLVAWLTPPQTWDSFSYHLSRVAHWQQNQSIHHYASGIERQNSMSPGAEFFTLTFYTLVGGDRLANLAEWSAMIGSLLAISLITRSLGANSFGQWLAAGFVATIPMGIVQASSTITDYVVTLWVICAAAETLEYQLTSENRSLIFASLAAALAILTKPTGVPYLLPFAILLTWLILKRQGFLGLLKWGMLATLIILSLNAGYLSRNLVTYSQLSNPADFEVHDHELRTPAGILSTVLKNTGIHSFLPGQESWNQLVFRAIVGIHVKLGLDVNDPRTTTDGEFQALAPQTTEDRATNPYHAYLILVILPVLWLQRRKTGILVLGYCGLTLAGFLLFCALFKWNGFGARYHLPFFVLFAPGIGVGLGALPKRLWGVSAILALFAGSLPWLLSIDSRPILPDPNRSRVGSILTTPRQELYFANTGDSIAYRLISDTILAQNCTQVGLILWGEDLEYLFWVLLGAPRQDLRMEWIVAGNPSARYTPQNFEPCAILCRDCMPEHPTIRGLVYIANIGGYQLYLPAP